MTHPSMTGTSPAMPAASHALVDGHVHLHDCFEVPDFLDAAAANFAAAAERLGLPAGSAGCLLLVESRGVDYFARLRDGTAPTGRWSVSPTDEPVSLVARRPGALPIVLVSGRQIVCGEGLEVLAIATRAEFDDGLPLADVIAAIRAAGALAVMPYGFGKWWFGRRRVLDDLLRSAQPGDLFLGDNGNRADLPPPPAAFRAAAQKRLWVLPGSDPLPMPAAVDRAGRNGFVLQGPISGSHPARDLVRLIRELSAQPQTFGRGEALAPFVRNQITMQLRKRRGTASKPAGALGTRSSKVLIVAPQPFFTPRGTPYSVYYRTLITAEMGFVVDLLTYGQGEDVDIPGVRIVRIPTLGFLGPIKIGPSWTKLLLDQLLIIWTLALLLRHRYDVVHAHEESVFFLRFLKPIFRFKLVYDMHSSLPEQLRNYRFTTSPLLIGTFERLEAACLKTADAVITICPELARYAVPRMPAPDRHFLIENSIFDEVRLKRPRAAAGPPPALPADRRVVLYAGTFEVYQGLGILIEAFAAAHRRCPSAFLVLIGGTPQQVAAARQQAAGLGLGEEHCLIIGQVPQATVRQYANDAYVLVSPRTHGTNTPLKIYEQLASGVPLVATRILSHTQVLNDDVCFLVEPEPAGLADGLVRALTDMPARRRVATNAKQLYATAYARPVYEGKLRNLFLKLGCGAKPLRMLAAARPSRHVGF
jgi:glycosyltransferase involved in cell wall biosynthesis